MNDDMSMSNEAAELGIRLAHAGLTMMSHARMRDTTLAEIGGAHGRLAVIMDSARHGTSLGVRVELPPEHREAVKDVHGDAALRTLGAVALAAHSRGLGADPIRGEKGLEGFVLRTGLGGTATPEQLRQELAALARVADELMSALPGPLRLLPERLVAQLGPRQGVYVEAAQAPEPAVIVPTYDLEQRATLLERSKRLGGG
jgi:hypothetical protein